MQVSFDSPKPDERSSWLGLLGTRALESPGDIGKFKCNEQPLFWSQSPGFVNLLFRKVVAKFARTPRTFENRSGSLREHDIIVTGNTWSVITFFSELFQSSCGKEKSTNKVHGRYFLYSLSALSLFIVRFFSSTKNKSMQFSTVCWILGIGL